MRRYIAILTIFVILLGSTACTSTNTNTVNEQEPETIEVRMSDAYSLVDELQGLESAGVKSYAGNIIMCNSGNNNLTILNEYGEIIRTFGSLGNGIDEFISPTGIDTSDNKIYILDAGNERIQIYSDSFTYLNSVLLDHLENTEEVYYMDISVTNDGRTYLTTNSSLASTSRVYVVNSDGNIETSTEPMYGFTYSDGENVYCINTFEIVQEDRSWTALFSHNYLYSVSENGNLTKLAELPYKYGPTDFVIDGKDLYVLSCGWGRLDHFLVDGTYVETLYQFEGLYPESYLTRTTDGFLVTDRRAQMTYVLSHE